MLTLGLTGRVWVCVLPQDGRKSYDGLAAVVTAHLDRDPLSVDLGSARRWPRYERSSGEAE